MFLTSKVRDLLVLLTLRRGGAWERGDLIDHLWPDSEEGNERNRLSVAVYHLRRLIDSVGGNGHFVIGADRRSIWLAEEVVSCDLWEFEDASAGLVDPDRRLACAQTMVSLYRGRLHTLGSADWLGGLRHSTSAGFAEAVEVVWRSAFDSGNRALAQEVLRESLVRDGESLRLLEGMAHFYEADGQSEAALELVESLIGRCRATGSVVPLRLREMVGRLRSAESDGTPVSSLEVRTVLDFSGGPLGGDLAAFGAAVIGQDERRCLLRNPLAAVELARDVIGRSAGGRALIRTEVGVGLQKGISAESIPEGEIWLNPAAAALVEAHSEWLVREAGGGAGAYRVLRE